MPPHRPGGQRSRFGSCAMTMMVSVMASKSQQLMTRNGVCLPDPEAIGPPSRSARKRDQRGTFCRVTDESGPFRQKARWVPCEALAAAPMIRAMKAKPILRFVRVLCVAGALVACGSGPGDATGSTCPTTSTLTYANFGEAFMQDHCLSCHSAHGPESPKFDSLAEIRAASSDIDRAAAAGPKAVNTYMPDGASVAEAERRKLGEWLACGAPE